VVETTLSGSYINKVAKRAKGLGYKITVLYFFVDDVKICLDRVKMRLEKGGHDVPEQDIERRFYRSFDNFWNHLAAMADEWILTYNGEFGFQQVAIGEGEKVSVENEVLFSLFNSKIGDNDNSK
jgi:predicted ABC-type ATPase